MTWKDRRVFVSGGAGVIGRELVTLLESEGASVLVGDLKPRPNQFGKGVRYRRGDLLFMSHREIESFRPEVFFHLAATFERTTETYEFWEENFHHNVSLSHHLSDIIRSSPSLSSVVFASSYLIYDESLYNFETPQEAAVELCEETPIRPRNLTGMAKCSHEMELDFLHRFQEAGSFNCVNARIFRGFGRNSRDVISRWVRALLNDEEILVFREEGIFDYIHARDSARGLKRLAEAEYSGTVNLGTGVGRRVSDVVKILSSHFPSANIRSANSDIPYEASRADTKLLRTVTGWVPELSLEEAIADVVEYETNNKEQLISGGNILVTSLSAKAPLVNAVRRAIQQLGTECKLIGADSNPECIARALVDDFWQMPPVDQITTADLTEELRRRNIRSIIPTRDGELEYWSSQSAVLREHDVQVMVSQPTAVITCLDKIRFYEQLSGLTDGPIPTFSVPQEVQSDRIVVKERYGAGSKNVAVNVDKDTAIQFASTLKDPIFQPFITGNEYSIDAYIAQSGEVKGLVCRSRKLVIDGESQITVADSYPKLERASRELIESLGLFGHVVIQAIVDPSEKIWFVECNCRVGGASTCSISCGLDSLYWFLLESSGEDLSDYPFVPADFPQTQIRMPTDLLIDGSGF